LARLIPGAHPVTVVESSSGHDGFLLETEQVGAVVASVLT
jgi:homoserine O-acetyltransferase/O-succinyltransferase